MQKAAQIDQRMATINTRIVQAEKELKKYSEEQDRLEREKQQALDSQKEFREKTAETKENIAKREQDLARLIEEETSANTENQNLARRVQDDKSRLEDEIAKLEEKMKTTTVSIKSVVKEQDKIESTLDQTNKAITAASTRQTNILKEYDMATNSSGIIQTLALAQEKFDDLLKKELQATKEAEANKEDLESQIATLDEKLKTSQQNNQDLEKEKLSANTDLQERKTNLHNLLEQHSQYERQHDQLQSRINELRTTYESKREEYDHACVQANDRVSVARQQIQNIQTEIDQLEDRRKEHDSFIGDHQNDDQESVSKYFGKIQTLENQIQQLDEVLKDLEAKGAHSDDEINPEDENFERKAERMMKGTSTTPSFLRDTFPLLLTQVHIFVEYPVLGDYDIVCKPELTANEQAQIDFAELIQESKKRLRSAEKYHKAMQKDARKNAKKEEAIQRHTELEEMRKQETRRRHNNRSQSNTSEDASEFKHKVSQSTAVVRQKSTEDLLDWKVRDGLLIKKLKTPSDTPENTRETSKADYSSLRASKLTASLVHPPEEHDEYRLSPTQSRNLLASFSTINKADSIAKSAQTTAPLSSSKKVHWEEDENPKPSQNHVVARTKTFQGRALVSNLHLSSTDSGSVRDIKQSSSSKIVRTSSEERSMETKRNTKESKGSSLQSTKNPSSIVKKKRDTRIHSHGHKKKHVSSKESEKECSKHRSHREAKLQSSTGALKIHDKHKSSAGASEKRTQLRENYIPSSAASKKGMLNHEKSKSAGGGKHKTSKRSHHHVSQLEVVDQKTKKRRRNKTFGSSSLVGTQTTKSLSIGQDVDFSF
jgi:predicted  nucleic acid-binding Zn-ribbon protein